MRDQAARFGAAELSRAADVVNTGLTEMRGATAPRLQLELLCARVLLPGADGEAGYGARLDRIERRLVGGRAGRRAPAARRGGCASSGGRPSRCRRRPSASAGRRRRAEPAAAGRASARGRSRAAGAPSGAAAPRRA